MDAKADVMQLDAWRGFKGDAWREKVAVREFIQDNYTPLKATIRSWPVRRNGQKASGKNWKVF